MNAFQAQQYAAIDDALTARLERQADEDAARIARVEACPSFPALRGAVTALSVRARSMPLGAARTWILDACGSMTGARWIGGLTVLRLGLRQASVCSMGDGVSQALDHAYAVLGNVTAELPEGMRKPVRRSAVDALAALVNG